ncbi:MAG: PDZ domain-containing protein [Chloroflexi bacterium]|nr:PDZ domain-containing protein [Chloroflexota bacterium]
MLTKKQAADILRQEDKNITPGKVAKLANENVFVGARKDKDGDWQIPAESISAYLEGVRRGKRISLVSGITWGSIGSIITVAIAILSLVTVFKDSLDLALRYLLPVDCEVLFDGAALTNGPLHPVVQATDADILDVFPKGTKIQVGNVVRNGIYDYYEVLSYSYDEGPVSIEQVTAGSPGDIAGLKAGDILLDIDDMPITTIHAFREYVFTKKGSQATLIVQRNGNKINLQLTPSLNPPPDQGPIGIVLTGGKNQGKGGYIISAVVSCPRLP